MNVSSWMLGLIAISFLFPQLISVKPAEAAPEKLVIAVQPTATPEKLTTQAAGGVFITFLRNGCRFGWQLSCQKEEGTGLLAASGRSS